MKVYEIVVGIEERRGQRICQVLANLSYSNPDDAGRFLHKAGWPWSGEWKSTSYYVLTPSLPLPDFFAEPNGWICNERAMLLVGEPMEMCGEYLPVQIEGLNGNFQLFHITNTINVLDVNRSEWRCFGGKRGVRTLVKRVFRAERFGEKTLFTIPEEASTRSYCLERTGDPEDGEFKALVEHHGLTGLRFDLVWSEYETNT